MVKTEGFMGSKVRFCSEKAAFMVKKMGILAFKGKDPGGSWYFIR
jgi:hypothetical protein